MSIKRIARTAHARKLAKKWLTDSLTRRRITLVSDGAGGQTESVATATFSGALGTANQPTEFQTADRQEGQTDVNLWVAVNTDLTVKDEVADGSGNTYEVVSGPVRETTNVLERFLLAHIGDNV